MGNKLSHSSINRFKMCPKSYELHYVERIRPTGTTSALVFGAALDAALNLILTGSPEKAEGEFAKQFTTQEINGVSTNLPTCKELSYSSADFDADILTESDVGDIEAQSEKLGLSGRNWLQHFKKA